MIDTLHKLLLQSQQLPLCTPVVSKTNQLGDLKSFHPGSYVPEFVQNHVQNLTTLQKAEWDDTVLRVYSAKGYKRFNSYMKDIQRAQNFLKCLGIVPHKVIINIIYIPGHKKEVKCENCILSPNEVNSGFYSMGTIWIYRSQELLKTTIHEMCHAYGIDSTRFHTIERRYIPSLLNVKFGKRHPNREICLTEGVVDFIACLIMAALRTAQPITKESLSNSLKLQATHILNQAEKILCLLSKTGSIENTHTYAYYVVKGILFGDLHASITFFQTNGWYVNTRESLERFLKFLVSHNRFKLPPATCMIDSKSLRMNVFE
jgi:hypothetical protein